MEIITVRYWNLWLKEIDRFVAEKTDGAASEPRQFRARNESIPRHQFADFVERVRRRVKALLGVAVDNADLPAVTLDDDPRFDSDEREPSRYIVFLSRLKKEAVTATIKFLEG